MKNNSQTLALLGGTPVIDHPFKKYKSVGQNEKDALIEVIESNCLSGFFGSWTDGFLGGPKVQAFEKAWSDFFKVKHTVSVNSNTSGLLAALGAVGVGPGDEVIVPATTMSATATMPLFYGGIPVFADLEEQTFCLSVDSVLENITDKTKAIICVNLFGQPAEVAKLRKIADDRGLFLIEDNAQAPSATENGKYTGTIGHIGVFSLNYHKHIHTGEGGMCTTNDDRLAERMQMIRNHAEAVVGPAGTFDLSNMLGLNLRMTEMSAAIGLVQLQEIEKHIDHRCYFANRLSAELDGLNGISIPVVRENCTHVYYDWILRYDEKTVGISRARFVEALQAEGFPCFAGYVAPLYWLPVFQERIGIGHEGYPFTLSQRNYDKGLCPVAERLHLHEIIGVEICAYEIDDQRIDAMIKAFKKVYDLREQL